jgi:hypothetical protein
MNWEIFRTQRSIKDDNEGGTAGWAILSGMRGRERRKAREVKEELLGKLDKVEDSDEARTVLESTLFRL